MNALVAESVSLTLGGRGVLSDVTLALRPGEVTAIVGPNGAGKSSLLTCLAGLRRPGHGAVRLAGADIFAMTPRERARRIGYLPQIAEIAWAVDVETLVGLGRIPYEAGRGLAADDRDAVARALSATGMTAMAARDVTTLSGGERARALIARLLAGEPMWLLADEPLAGLDPGHQLDALALLRDFAARPERGVVLTLHDLGLTARLADRVVVLAEGRVIADGTPRGALTTEVLGRTYGIKAMWIEGAAGPVIELVGRV